MITKISTFIRSKSFSTNLSLLLLILAGLLFLVIPLSVIRDPDFWSVFYSQWNFTLAFRVVKSLGHMGPTVGFSALLAYSIGSFASNIVIGHRYAPRVISLCFMFGLYGVVVGFLMGASKEPAAKEAITSLVTIVSGAFGYFISKDLTPRFKAMVPPALACFLLSLMFSAHYYSSLKR
jgi:hypothetical protein